MKLVLAAILGMVVGGAGIAALTLPRLHRHYTRVVAVDDLRVAMGARADADAAAAVPILCWGDSLTEGKTASPGHDFPSILRLVFGRPAINRGVSGEKSAQIAARVVSRGERDAPENAVFWSGRNDDRDDMDGTERRIAEMVNSLPPGSHYLVLGILNADTVRERRGGDLYGRIVALNQRLAATYGPHYVPIREWLVGKADVTRVDDRVAVDADVVPPSLRTDALHLSDQGEAFVAVAIETAIRGGGW